MKKIVCKRDVLEWTTEYCVFEVPDTFDGDHTTPDELDAVLYPDGEEIAHSECLSTEPLEFVEAEAWEYVEDHDSDVCECYDSGYLLNQEYGLSDMPDDWTPVQACNLCELGRNLSDQEAAQLAAMEGADVEPIEVRYFPPARDEDDDPEDVDSDAPGDWGIHIIAGRN